MEKAKNKSICYVCSKELEEGFSLFCPEHTMKMALQEEEKIKDGK